MTIERTVKNKDEAQALAGFLWNEKERHLDDVQNIIIDLLKLKKVWKVQPRRLKEFVKP